MTALILSRRALLGGAAAAAGFAAFGSRPALAAIADIDFEVYRNKSMIGHHHIRVTPATAGLTVDIEIEFKVKAAFITAFSYSHRNRETWFEEELNAIETVTNDNGKSYRLTGARAGNDFIAEGSAGRIAAPRSIVPTSYWNRDILNETTLLDTQRGKLIKVAVAEAAETPVTVAGAPIAARHYKITGDLNIDLWYAGNGEWVKLAFKARSSEIEYIRTNPLSG